MRRPVVAAVDREQELAGGRGLERADAGHHLVEDHAQGVDVGARRRARPLGLLRSHVGDRADELTGRRRIARGQPEVDGQPEVEDLDQLAAVVGRGDHDVGRLEVAVDDAAAVAGLDRGAHRGEQPGGAGRGQRPGGERVGQRRPVELLHHQVGAGVGILAVVEDLDHVGVADVGGGLGLGGEAAAAGRGVLLGEQPLERHLVADRQPARRVDLAHPAGAERAQDLVAAIDDDAGREDRRLRLHHDAHRTTARTPASCRGAG